MLSQFFVQRQASGRGYYACHLGLNNQKLALLGLISGSLHARINRITMPDLSVFDPSQQEHPVVDFFSIFEPEPFAEFCDIIGLQVIEGEKINTEHYFSCFAQGASLLGTVPVSSGLTLQSVPKQFFKYLIPRIYKNPLFEKVRRNVFVELGIQTVAQFRIENDWKKHTDFLQNHTEFKEKSYFSFYEIAEKITKTFNSSNRKIFIACNENDLIEGKLEIKECLLKDFGIDAYFKSDFVSNSDLDGINIIEKAIFDFELAVCAPYFVGTSASTFSNLVGFEKFCRQKEPITTHYIYNTKNENLMMRTDNGAYSDAVQAIDPIFSRIPMQPYTVADCLWPAQLLLHIQQKGDVVSETSPFPGVRDGILQVGDTSGAATRPVEGLCLHLQNVAEVSVEYRVMDQSAHWGDWHKSGTFVGSRGEQRNIYGVAFRLIGKNAHMFDVVYAIKYCNDNILHIFKNGEHSPSKTHSPVAAVQVVFRSRS